MFSTAAALDLLACSNNVDKEHLYLSQTHNLVDVGCNPWRNPCNKLEEKGSLVTLLNISTTHCQKLNLAKEALQCQTWPCEPTGDWPVT